MCNISDWRNAEGICVKTVCCMSFSPPVSRTHCTSIQTHGFMGMHVSGELQVEINTPAFYFNNCTFKWTWHLFECDFPICARTLLSAFSFFLLLLLLMFLLLIFKWKVDTNVRVVLASLDNSACREKEIQRETYQVQLKVLSYMLSFSGTLTRCL